ncbi:unnamed protein product [Miscanthus lutarioriparius]|uniref:Uncharacterized protein n=1 Tax=Miscanthus lutarioriparius TaxID=422564 RepID=A0A811RHM6_9POAL|nr:unnamed protein product [Miscanthus lutarioriparius]
MEPRPSIDGVPRLWRGREELARKKDVVTEMVPSVGSRPPGGGVIISFVLAGAACVLNALCYAELASRFPAMVGGAYLYTYAAFNEITAFLVFTQLMVDYHISAASIARSLASYFIQFLELIPFLEGQIPSWIGHGVEFFSGVVSINILAPILLIILTVILCYGVKESSAVNTFMTTLEIIIVIFVVFAGVFEVDVSNWSPFMPNGFKSVVTGATVVFFAYVGLDAVANSAEEAKRPQGLKFVTVLISIGAVAGLTTTFLIGLYVQSCLYLGLGRDGLLPSVFAKVHPTRHIPLQSQIWVGCVAAVMAGLFNVTMLSHILSVGTLTGYSVVSACVITLRWNDKGTSRLSLGSMSIRQEGVLCLVIVALCDFIVGLCYRFNCAVAFMVVSFVIAVAASFALQFRQVYVDPPGFSCPGVPLVPIISVFFNMVLFAQYNAVPSSSEHSTIGYHGIPSEAP